MLTAPPDAGAWTNDIVTQALANLEELGVDMTGDELPADRGHAPGGRRLAGAEAGRAGRRAARPAPPGRPHPERPLSSGPMAPLLLLNADDVRSLIDLPALFDALERALRDLSAGNASVPPRTVARTRDGFLGSMPGYLPGTLEAKLVAVFPGNHERGLPSHQALIALFDEETGVPLCVMDGTVITAVRTGATTAVAARALARADARTLAILGAGVQGASHLDAFPEPVRARRHPRRLARPAARRDARRVPSAGPGGRVVRGGRARGRPRVLLHRRG